MCSLGEGESTSGNLPTALYEIRDGHVFAPDVRERKNFTNFEMKGPLLRVSGCAFISSMNAFFFYRFFSVMKYWIVRLLLIRSR